MVIVSAIAVTVYLGGWYFPFVYRLTEARVITPLCYSQPSGLSS